MVEKRGWLVGLFRGLRKCVRVTYRCRKGGFKPSADIRLSGYPTASTQDTNNILQSLISESDFTKGAFKYDDR